MKLSVTVQYKAKLAHYSIRQETSGVYLATLEQYEGPFSEAPPAKIMLVKGFRRWAGSFEHQDILNDLGRAIDISLGKEHTKDNLRENSTKFPSGN
ncbi:hypothetical protein OCK74_17690 [Chitinophagaceae bacterium LB-8]|uniref:Uncharacterized protein n=1 Tax=Paraflavisolibacter caeni TaxID=2982496 RepID=A0A9X3BJB2_9BACT|nr:hypothetical protein [Paraflavisolibacter caeni]MCU7550958.1 hypothetical protein [Paraflavisolibacter caeni]